jgi:hypothetical protein
MKKGYKVVLKTRDSRYFSCVMGSLYGGVEYKIGIKTKPQDECGPLCIFENLEDAIDFKDYYVKNRALFECNYIPSNDTDIWSFRDDCSLYSRKNVSNLPWKTKLASSITLLKEIDNEEGI